MLANKNFLKLFLLIPVLNTVAAITTNYFGEGSLNPGIIRAIIVWCFTLYILFNYFPKDKISVSILLYNLFLLTLVFLSSNFQQSFYLFLKVSISFLMFPISFYFINNLKNFKKLMSVFVFVTIILLINFLFANIYKIGTSDYLNDSFYFGVGRVEQTKILIVLAVISPIIISFYSGYKRKYIILLFIVAYLISIIGIKRSVLLTAITSPIIYGLFSKYKKRIIRSLILVAAISAFILILFPSYYDTFKDRLQAREDKGRLEFSEETMDTEARYNEFKDVTSSWLNGSIKHMLIGSEWLNDRAYFNKNRMLHTDYMILLNGSGIIGLIWWFYILFLIFRKLNIYYRYVKDDPLFNTLYALFHCLLVAQILMSLSGTIYSIELRSGLMIFWGAGLGLMKNYTQEKISNEYSIIR